ATTDTASPVDAGPAPTSTAARDTGGLDGRDETPAPPPSTVSEPAPAETPAPAEGATVPAPVWPLDDDAPLDPAELVADHARRAIGVDDPVVEPAPTTSGEAGEAAVDCRECSAWVVKGRGEDGRPFGAAWTALVDEEGDRPVIVELVSAEMHLTAARAVSEDLISVAGRGRSFEGAGEVVVRSRCDPEGVATPVLVGGGPEFAEVHVAVPATPCSDPLVVEFRTAGGGLATDVPSVAARSIEPASGFSLGSPPGPDAGRQLEEARRLVAWARGRGPAPRVAETVWIGGIGVYADAPTPLVPLPSGEFVADAVFDADPFPDEPDTCDPAECRVSVRDFLGFAALGDRVDTALVHAGVLADSGPLDIFTMGPVEELARFATQPSVTVELAPSAPGELDWARWHVWFDDDAHVLAVWRWGWTP
ncbi:MAG: hypothetical protein D6683_05510, partial [Actinomyces sp.]